MSGVIHDKPPLSFCSALILGAGRSSRMGEPKPLLPLGDQTVIESVIGLFRGAGVAQIVVVLGHQADLILPRIERLGADSVINARYDEGMFSSVQAGVSRLDRGCGAFFVLPVDTPLVRPETLGVLMDAFRKGDVEACRPSFQGRCGHPPLISAALIPAIRDFEGEGGLRALLALHKERVKEVPVEDPGILLNLNTREDYAAALERISRPDPGSPLPSASR